MKKLLLIDGMAVVYRAYFALNRNPRINTKGMNTSAILGFATTLYDLMRSQRPTHIAVAFDLQKPTFRHEMYSEYKANRDAMPEEIQQSLPWIRKIIEAMAIPILTCEGYEADDVIGTISHKAEKNGFDRVLMVSPDKDFAQLVTDTIHLYRFGRMGKPDQELGVEEVKEKFGVSNCRQVIDILALWGDSSDNIPGIAGVGEKTAKKLIADYDSVEGIIAHADEIKNDKIRTQVIEHKDDALLSKTLATITLNAPIDFDEEALLLKAPDVKEMKEITDYLELRQFAKRFFTDLSVSHPDLAMAFSKAKPSVESEKTTNIAAASSPSPTLFDAINKVEEAPQRRTSPLTEAVLNNLYGQDVAVFIDGCNILLASSSEKIWTTEVSNLNISAFKRVIEHPSSSKICFDIKGLKYILEELECGICGQVFDVQLVHYLLDAEKRHNLEYIAASYLEYEPTDSFAMISALWKMYPIMKQRLSDDNLSDIYYNMELPLVDVLISMEHEGVRIDVKVLQDYAATLSSERAEIEKKIYFYSDSEFNISSSRQLGEVLYDQLKITNKPPLTATKQYSTAEEVLTKLVDKHPIVPLILEYRSITKLIGTYLDSFPRLINPQTKRLHTVYNQTVTATGRLSSSNPNLQNIPIRTERGREIRRAFVARDEDFLLLAADYSQIELRIIASLSQDKNLMEAFNNGYDIHAATASKIYGIPLEEVSKEQRRNAKSVNFGIVYGISAFGLSQQLGISRTEASALIEQYFSQYPDIRRYIDDSVAKAQRDGYAQTLLGRRRYLPDINSRNAPARAFAERNAVNMPIQGTSADMIKLAMIGIEREFKKAGLRSKMILQVHDEVVIDMAKEEQEVVQGIVEQQMKTALPLKGVKIDVGIDVGTNWLEAH